MSVTPLPQHDQPDPCDRYRGYVKNVADLMRETFPPVQFAVQGVIPEGYVVLAGAPKVGKSWLVLDVLLAIARGTTALGVIPGQDPRPVLYMALEDNKPRIQRRLGVLGVGTDDGPRLFDYVVAGVVPPAELLDVAATFLRDHADERPVVCIDTLAKIPWHALPGQSAYDRDYALGSRLKAVAAVAEGCTVLAVHHTRKAAADDWMDGVSGTNGVNGAADATLVVTRKRGDDVGRLSITGRDIESDGTLAMTCAGMRWELDGADVIAALARADEVETTASLSDRSAEIVTYVGKNPAGVSPNDVARDVHMDNKLAGDYLSRLAKAGRIRKVGRGKYCPAMDSNPTPEEGLVDVV